MKKSIITLNPGEKYRWIAGCTIEAVEKSAFILPGGIFENGKPMSSVMTLSDNNTEIIKVGDTNTNSFPDIAVILNPKTQLTILKNCEVIHVHLHDEEKRSKKFYIIS